MVFCLWSEWNLTVWVAICVSSPVTKYSSYRTVSKCVRTESIVEVHALVLGSLREQKICLVFIQLRRVKSCYCGLFRARLPLCSGAFVVDRTVNGVRQSSYMSNLQEFCCYSETGCRTNVLCYAPLVIKYSLWALLIGESKIFSRL